MDYSTWGFGFGERRRYNMRNFRCALCVLFFVAETTSTYVKLVSDFSPKFCVMTFHGQKLASHVS